MDQVAQLFREGGPVMWPIAAASLAAWWLALANWRTSGWLLRSLAAANRYLERSRATSRTTDARRIEPVSIEERARLDQSLAVVKTLVALLPLLGLLGTVTGMLATFQVIQGHGTGEPRLLAGGIREALITTEAGLLAAFPVLILHERLSSRLRRAEGEELLFLHKLRAADPPDARFGEIAADLGFVSRAAVDRALALQAERPGIRIGEILLEGGDLNPLERRIILILQERSPA